VIRGRQAARLSKSPAHVNAKSGSAASLCGRARPFRPNSSLFLPPPLLLAAGRLSLPAARRRLVGGVRHRKGTAFPQSRRQSPGPDGPGRSRGLYPIARIVTWTSLGPTLPPTTVGNGRLPPLRHFRTGATVFSAARRRRDLNAFAIEAGRERRQSALQNSLPIAPECQRRSRDRYPWP